MAKYEHRDHYFERAKTEGRISRSSYKIEELQKKFRLISRGNRVLDLGCAPGGWLVQIVDWVGPTGRIVGIDLDPPGIALPKQAEWVQADIDQFFQTETGELTPALGQLLGGKAHVVVSDMAPHTTGTKFQDQIRSAELLETAWAVAEQILQPNGHFVAKFFEGPDAQQLRKRLVSRFSRVSVYSPGATRKGSIEKYLVAVGLRTDQ